MYVPAAPWVHVFECTVHVGPGLLVHLSVSLHMGLGLHSAMVLACRSCGSACVHLTCTTQVLCVMSACVSTGVSTIQVGSPAMQALIIE